MSDKLYTYPIDKLLKWILNEEKQGKIFGIYKELLFSPSSDNPFRIKRYGKLLETPIGVAAGPHTQMSQNIIAAWLTGSRYIELKTVQTLDELDVAKPCIEMKDEGYNCEWSQELKIKQSFDEYLNAWILIHILKDKFGWDNSEEGFIFNMSVGYDLAGIMQLNVQWFFDKMNDASAEIAEKVELLSPIYPRIRDLRIPSRLSDNVTLSTMHGCPPDEIESIAEYLLKERKLNTAVKLNPTLLGPEKLRYILNDKLGFKTVVPDVAFEHDLKYEDAKRIIDSLIATAKENNVEFGLKLTNTLESLNSTEKLPEDQEMVYMSGRALHPISINLAAKLQNDFDGVLDISFSAGVDAFNVPEVLRCNIKPVTVCSDLLKPGGYTRTSQYIENIEAEMNKYDAKSIDEFVLSSANGASSIKSAALDNLNRYAESVLDENRYNKSAFHYDGIKTNRELTTYDCIEAPCMETCAISQDVPDYMYYTAKGDFEKAFEVIATGNPLPNVTGMVCDHLCQTKCTRINYDEPLLIREIKRFISEKHEGDFILKPKEKNGLSVSVIGAGPSGLSAAYFLALEGFNVTVYEQSETVGGMPASAIPNFRIDDNRINEDVKNLERIGVTILTKQKINSEKFNELQNNSDFIFIGVGAQVGKKLNIEGENLSGVYDQLEFLALTRNGKPFALGKSVAVIGAGNSAMDAARTAKRIVGKNNNVTVVYRRTIEEAPADKEEIAALIEEGIEIIELAQPVEISENIGRKILKCQKMELSTPDNSGRRKPVPLKDNFIELSFDSIITAVGQDVILDFFPGEKLEIDEITKETQIKNVFAGGDAVRGADSLINAIADGKYAAGEIIKQAQKDFNFKPTKVVKNLELKDYQKLISKKVSGVQMPVIKEEKRFTFELVHPLLDDKSAIEEASRCMFCNDVCNICVSDCPNLANLSYEAKPWEVKYPVVKLNGNTFEVVSSKTFRTEQTTQIINIGDFCNECGNCDTFCPTSGAPYKTKPKVYLTNESFAAEDNCYFIDNNEISFKLNNSIQSVKFFGNVAEYFGKGIRLKFIHDNFDIIYAESKNEMTIDFSKIAEMVYLFNNLTEHPLFGES